MTKEIYFVHAIDTEGPLYETLDAKFDRIKDVYNIDIKERTEENLDKIKQKKIDLGGKENDIALMLSGHLTNYNDNWKKIELMNNKIFNEDFRFTDPDSSGNTWVFSWHCLDH